MRLERVFSTNYESDYEHEILKQVPRGMREVSNLVLTSLKLKFVVRERVEFSTETVSKVDLIYFADFKCALEDLYRHQHIYLFKFCAENRIWAGIIGTVIAAF